MPNIKSAIKRVRITEKKTLENNRIKSAYKTAVKKYEVANANGDKDAAELLNKAKRAIDQAATKGVISKNAASRKISRLESKLAVKSTKKAEAKKPATKKAEEKPATEKAETKKTATAKKTETKKTATKSDKKDDDKKSTAKKTTKKAEEK